jgi:hypothetical protein
MQPIGALGQYESKRRHATVCSMRAALLLLVGGCSFALTESPRPHKPCTTSDVAPIIDTAAGVGLAAFSIYLVARGGDDYAESNDSAYATMTGVSAFIYAIAATRGWGNVSACRDHQIEIDHERELAQKSKVPPPAPDEVWRLVRLASAAARDGNCAAVVGIGRALREIDAQFHDTVFMKDEAVVRCLATPRQTGHSQAQPQPEAAPTEPTQPEPTPTPAPAPPINPPGLTPPATTP